LLQKDISFGMRKKDKKKCHVNSNFVASKNFFLQKPLKKILVKLNE
jgi:hypothetical protein